MSVGQEFRSGSAVWLWVRISRGHSLACSYVKAWLGLRDPLTRWLIHSCWQESRFLATWTSPWGCWSVLITGQLAFPGVSDPREGKVEATMLSCDLAIEVTRCRFCSFLLGTQVSPVPVSVTSRRGELLGAILQAGSHRWLPLQVSRWEIMVPSKTLL